MRTANQRLDAGEKLALFLLRGDHAQAEDLFNKAIAAKALPPGSKFLDEEYVRKWKLSKRFPRQIYRDDMGNVVDELEVPEDMKELVEKYPVQYIAGGGSYEGYKTLLLLTQLPFELL